MAEQEPCAGRLARGHAIPSHASHARQHMLSPPAPTMEQSRLSSAAGCRARLDVLQCPRKPHFARACAPTLRKPSVARRRQSAASRLWACICACVGSRYHPPHNACFVTDASRLSTQVVSPGDQRCNAKTVAKRRSVRADAASTFRYITILSIVDWFGSPWSSPCTVYGNLGRRCSCRCEMIASQVKLDGALTSLERWQARQYLPWLLLRRCTSSDVA
jgi:hypothetical protein